MSHSLNTNETAIAETIGDWAGRLLIDSGPRAEHKARNAAETLADDVLTLTMFSLPKRVAFRGLAGHTAAKYVRTFQ